MTVLDNEACFRKEWMTNDQWFCCEFLAEYFFGWHHVPSKIKEHGSGIEVNFQPHRMATYDFNGMTRLVLMAHAECVRADIAGSGPQLIKLILHKRPLRSGSMWERHPNIQDAIEVFEKNYRPLSVRQSKNQTLD